MKIKMLVSVSRSDGFSARIGEERETNDEQASQLIADGLAEEMGTDAMELPTNDIEPEAVKIQRKCNAGRSKP